MDKRSAGRFKVTQGQQGILALVPDEHDGWTHLLRRDAAGGIPVRPEADEADQVDVSGLVPGDRYPGPVEPATTLRYRQRAGGVIARRIPGGESFARGPRGRQARDRPAGTGSISPADLQDPGKWSRSRALDRRRSAALHRGDQRRSRVPRNHSLTAMRANVGLRSPMVAG